MEISILQILKIIALIGTAAGGLPALIKPQSIYGFTGVNAPGVRGTSEIRAIFGGLLIGLGLAPLILGTLQAYQVVGIGYLAIAFARAFSIVFDKSYAASNLISLGVELIFAAILVV